MRIKKNLQMVRKLIGEKFGISEEDLERGIYSGRSDPGGWSQNADIIIHAENYDFVGYYDFDSCFRLTELVNDAGLAGYFDWVNSAVLAFYAD